MALPAPSSPPFDPLSHARAGFSNHIGRSKPMSNYTNGYHTDGSDAESSKDAQAREKASLEEMESPSLEEERGEGDWRRDLKRFEESGSIYSYSPHDTTNTSQSRHLESTHFIFYHILTTPQHCPLCPLIFKL